MPNLAILTRDESAVWEKVYADVVNSGGSEDEADEEAWTVTQGQFPRLRHFDGCFPDDEWTDTMRPVGHPLRKEGGNR